MSAFGDIVKEVKYIDDDLYVSFDEENYRRLELKLTIQENEIERLNNIINELEKVIQENKFWIYNDVLETRENFEVIDVEYILDNLKELKENK